MEAESNATDQPKQSVWKRLLAPFALLIAGIAKFKGIFFAALKFLPFLLKTGGTMVLSIGAYAMLWGWQFALGFVLLIFVHECGHLLAARHCGLKVGLPVFIPFMGAVIALKEAPRNAWIEATVGIGGPLLGTAGALICLLVYQFNHVTIFLVLAYSGFWLNLFNLIPIVPLDGGRVASALSPWLWVVGIVLLIVVLMQSSWNLFLLVIVGLSLPRVFSLFRKRTETERRYFELTSKQMSWMGFQYFCLAGMLGYLMHMTHQQIEAIRQTAMLG
jgi:Zn-dependent protease